MMSGIEPGSYHKGEPQQPQNTRLPPPESYLRTLSVDVVSLKLSARTTPHAAWPVPENLRQDLQWQ
jgi:hypothetical protein